jgi:hypothetical protein
MLSFPLSISYTFSSLNKLCFQIHKVMSSCHGYRKFRTDVKCPVTKLGRVKQRLFT